MAKYYTNNKWFLGGGGTSCLDECIEITPKNEFSSPQIMSCVLCNFFKVYFFLWKWIPQLAQNGGYIIWDKIFELVLL